MLSGTRSVGPKERIKRWKKQPALAVHQARSALARLAKMEYANAHAAQTEIARVLRIARTAIAVKALIFALVHGY